MDLRKEGKESADRLVDVDQELLGNQVNLLRLFSQNLASQVYALCAVRVTAGPGFC